MPDYDYSAAGAYFITICTKDRQTLFWSVGDDAVGATIGRPSDLPLTPYGRIADEAVRDIPRHYPSVSVDAYTVMPNHIHILLQIRTDAHGRAMLAPTISTVIQQTKGYITKRIGYSIWQRSYHDHIVRDRADYDAIWEYIHDNPRRWREDALYGEA